MDTIRVRRNSKHIIINTYVMCIGGTRNVQLMKLSFCRLALCFGTTIHVTSVRINMQTNIRRLIWYKINFKQLLHNVSILDTVLSLVF